MLFGYLKRLLLAPLLLTLITGCNFYDKTFQERRDDCADTSGGKRSFQSMIDKYKLGGEFIKNRNVKELSQDDKERILTNFCNFYLTGDWIDR